MTLCTVVYGEPPFWVKVSPLSPPPFRPIILKSLATPLHEFASEFGSEKPLEAFRAQGQLSHPYFKIDTQRLINHPSFFKKHPNSMYFQRSRGIFVRRGKVTFPDFFSGRNFHFGRPKQISVVSKSELFSYLFPFPLIIYIFLQFPYSFSSFLLHFCYFFFFPGLVNKLFPVKNVRGHFVPLPPPHLLRHCVSISHWELPSSYNHNHMIIVKIIIIIIIIIKELQKWHSFIPYKFVTYVSRPIILNTI